MRYYLNEPSQETRYTIFGKRVALMLEQWKAHKPLTAEQPKIDKEFFDVLKKVPKYQFPEHRISFTVEDIPVLCVIDSFSKQKKAILEYKTSKNPWTNLMVLKHEQLDMYSLAVKEKYGSVNPRVKLVWLETEFAPEMQQVGSRQIEGDSDQLRFTGHMEIFERTINEYERKHMKSKIIKTAYEINDDYQDFLKNYGHKPEVVV